MCREKDYREKKKTGKRLFISISCLVLLSGIVMLFTCMLGKVIEGKEDRADLIEASDKKESGKEIIGGFDEKEEESIFRQAEGFDNPIDDLYLPVIFGSSAEDRTEVLVSYEGAWRGQLEEYLKDYRSRCRHARDKEMVEEYSAAIQRAVDAQKELMDYMGVEEERQIWYSAQIYRCAFIKDIRGEFAVEGMGHGTMPVSSKEMEIPAKLDYEVCGEFINDIDRQYAASMYEGCEAEIRDRQETFDLDWCNELGELTLEFYENLDEEGKHLAGIWQESRESWKAVSDPRLWWSPEELNAKEEDYLFWGNGTSADLMEKYGWINRLYYLQLQSMMEEDTEDEQNEHSGEALWLNGQKALFDLFMEGKNRAPLATYPLEKGVENDCEQIWQICSGILGEKDVDAWEHDTWYMLDGDTGKKTEEGMVLYQTKEGEQGFFYIKGKILYRVKADTGVEKIDMNILKEQIEYFDGEEKTDNSQWEAMLWKVWECRQPDDGLHWEDEKIKKAVYNEIGYSSMVPSREEVMSLSGLQVANAEQVRTFGDLRKLPALTSLTLSGSEEINVDITWDMVPGLEELFFRNIPLDSADFLEELPDLKVLGMICCNLTDISFLERYPHLTEVSFYGNEISDISPLTNCKDLEVISLAYNNVADISALSQLPKLKEAGLQGNQITDISVLESFEGLEMLNLNSNQIVDLSPLEGLKGLTALGAADNQIKDITPLKGLTKIYNLSLDANEISNIDALSNMKEMEYLGLSRNLIEDYTPIMDMENLYSLSVEGNPGQDIGKLVFTPWLGLGSGYEVEKEEIERMQACLNLYYPEEEILAEDFAKGDINGDGIEDVAITGLVGVGEESEFWSGERYVYPLIGRGDGEFIPLTPMESLGPGMGGVYGDPYQGIIITDHMLVIQVYGGSNWRWGNTEIYQYEGGKMEEKWEVSLEHFVMTSGMDFTIYDKESDHFKHYLVVGEIEEHKDILLIAESNGEPDARKEELDALLKRFEEDTAKSFPEVRAGDAAPELDGWYDYHICNYPVTKEPAWVLKQMAEELLEKALPLPAVYYTSEEIRESYGKMIGVEPPEVFYIGLMEEEPVLLYYNGCIQKGDGFVHEIVLRTPDEGGEYWRANRWIYYDESTDTYTLKNRPDD